MATTFFFISKIAWLLIKPLHSLLFCLLAWLGCRRLGWAGSARFFLALLLLYGGAILLTPLPELAVRSLENRFPVPQAAAVEAVAGIIVLGGASGDGAVAAGRAEEHTSELQSLMRIPSAVFCLKKKKKKYTL